MSEGHEMSASFVGRIHRYHGEQEDPSYQATSVIDVRDSGKEVEIAWDEGTGFTTPVVKKEKE